MSTSIMEIDMLNLWQVCSLLLKKLVNFSFRQTLVWVNKYQNSRVLWNSHLYGANILAHGFRFPEAEVDIVVGPKAAPMALVTSLGAEYPVVIFSKSSCSISHSIKTLICSFGANPTVYEIDEHPTGQQMERELKGLGRKPSIPAVFIGQELIGGSSEVFSLHLKGKLVPLLLNANAIWV